jgi:hypothetical protein
MKSYSPAPHPRRIVPQPSEIPSPQRFFVQDALNVVYKFEPQTQREVVNFLLFPTSHVAVDAYCMLCGADTVFQGTNAQPNETQKRFFFANTVPPDVYTYTARLVCSRNRGHLFDVAYQIGNGWFRKIGQYPSIADLAGDHFKEYKPVLHGDRLRELNRAVGLFSHDIGIGSFVYLRRTFEWLVEEAETKASAEGVAISGEGVSQRMEDRIKRVEHHLPAFLIENRSVYGILSKGIHELSEDECKKHFPTVRAGIEVILDDHLATFKKDEKQRAARAAIQAANAEISGEAKG